MKGYFRKRGDKWYFTIDIGKDPKTGKRKQKSKGGFKTKKEAQEQASKLYYELTAGTYINENKIRFKEFALDWFERYKNTVKPSTAYNADFNLKRLFSVLSDIEIQKITPKTYQNALNHLMKDYAIRTVKNTHVTARVIFKEAHLQELVKRDPTKFATFPHEEPDTLYQFLEPDERKRFLKVAKKEGLYQDYELFHLMMHTGLRLGECLALKWDCIDFDNQTLEVKYTVYNPTNNRQKCELISPKTKSSKRVVELDTYTLNILETHYKNQLEWKMLNRKFYHDHDFVFPKKYGEPEVHTVFQYHFRRLLELAKIKKKLRPHDLRHTHTVMLIEQGIDIKYIQKRLGHSDINTTLNIYSHVSERITKQSMDKIEKNVVKL